MLVGSARLSVFTFSHCIFLPRSLNLDIGGGNVLVFDGSDVLVALLLVTMEGIILAVSYWLLEGGTIVCVFILLGIYSYYCCGVLTTGDDREVELQLINDGSTCNAFFFKFPCY